MYLMPLLATLMSCVFTGALPMVSRNLGHRGTAVFSIISLIIAFISSAFIWFDLYIGSSPVWLDLFGPWFEVGTVTVSWIFYYDLLTAHMLFTVTSVSLAVHIFAVVYMRSDPHLSLFMSYLSLFTFFMLVYVCGDNLLVMLVGWEGIISHMIYFDARAVISEVRTGFGTVIAAELIYLTKMDDNIIQCLSGAFFLGKGHNLSFCMRMLDSSRLGQTVFAIQHFHTSHISALKRIGPHSMLMNEIIVGFLLGDGWLEKRGEGVRLGISLIEKFKDVAAMYQKIFFDLGYVAKEDLPDKPLVRTNRPTAKPYYQIRTFSFNSFLPFYTAWYAPKDGKPLKVIPSDIEIYLTPRCLAIWIMGDGSGMADGGFKLCSHSFSKEENLLLCDLLFKLHGLKATIQNEGSKGLTYIYVWKQSVPLLKDIVLPYIKDSCLYKFRHVKQKH